MERVAFLIAETGERIDCLLNPEGLTLTRQAGVRRRHSVRGPLTGAQLSDDPLLYTGGGTTEFVLDLLFDVSLNVTTPAGDDVRDLTRQFWGLAENVESTGRYGAPQEIIFFWGKAWSIPAVVVSVAERFEQFNEAGFPRRSWLRMKLRRITLRDPENQRTVPPAGFSLPVLDPLEELTQPETTPTDDVDLHGIIGDGESAAGAGERLDELAYRQYGDPAAWRLLAVFNQIDDPLHIPAGSVLRLPKTVAAQVHP